LPGNVALECGLGFFSERAPAPARLVGAAEGALADSAKAGGAVLAPVESGTLASGQDLAAEIRASIDAGRIGLLAQKVLMIDGEDVLQVEMLSRLSGSDGRPIPAATFVPIASQHGLLGSLDLKVVERALQALERVTSLPWTVSVNVSMQSIAEAAFRAGLKALLARNPVLARRLVFEITGYAASHSPDLAKAFAAELRASGVRIALDNFDLDRNSMTIVHELLPAYLKLAPAFTQQIAAREDLRLIVEAMVRMLRPLGIPLIAQGVEDATVVSVLAALGLAGYQGYAGGRPEPLPEA